MRNTWITIEREYGSGGTAVARGLSEATGVPCYGREILEEVSRQRGVDIERIQMYEETAADSLTYALLSMSKSAVGGTDILTEEDKVFIAEQEIIRKFAEKGSAIFLGHCASEALKNRHRVVKVFIRCSDADQKRQRIIEEYKIPEKNVEATRRKFDKKRANYYRVNNGRRWNDPDNYDIVLDTKKLGVAGCIHMLKGLLQDDLDL